MSTFTVHFVSWVQGRSEGTLRVRVNEHVYEWHHVSPYIYDKFRYTLDHNRGRALAYLHGAIGKGRRMG